MEKERYFLNSGIQPPLQFEPAMHAWNTFTSAQELNCSSSDQTSSCFLNPNWEMESAFSSMVSSSPATLNSAVPTDALGLRELIRKLGPLSSSGEMPKTFPAAPSYPGNTSFNTCCHSTPILNQNLPNSRNSVPLNPALHALSADPGFSERAAKFSCFGSRSFNARTSQFEQNNTELPYRSGAPAMGNGKLPRVSSSPSLKQDGSPPLENKNLDQAQMEMRPADGLIPANSNEESSVSEQVQGGETGLKAPNELNSRKRKAVGRGKSKEDSEANVKRSKLTEADVSENGDVKTEEEAKGGDNKTRDGKSNQKPPEAPKDYIHVRARRGQATDAHSLAERVRREKISERMKLLQDLVPGCNKVTGKALMLDEIINYVQSLQRQVEFLSMKLASVNPRLDNMDNLLSKDGFQPNASLPHPLFPMGSSQPTLPKNQPQQGHQLHNNGSVDDVDNTFCRNLGLHLPPLDGPFDGIPQFPPFCEDDLQSIVQMGYSQNPDTQIFPVANQASHMKIEL